MLSLDQGSYLLSLAHYLDEKMLFISLLPLKKFC